MFRKIKKTSFPNSLSQLARCSRQLVVRLLTAVKSRSIELAVLLSILTDKRSFTESPKLTCPFWVKHTYFFSPPKTRIFQFSRHTPLAERVSHHWTNRSISKHFAV